VLPYTLFVISLILFALEGNFPVSFFCDAKLSEDQQWNVCLILASNRNAEVCEFCDVGKVELVDYYFSVIKVICK